MNALILGDLLIKHDSILCDLSGPQVFDFYQSVSLFRCIMQPNMHTKQNMAAVNSKIHIITPGRVL